MHNRMCVHFCVQLLLCFIYSIIFSALDSEFTRISLKADFIFFLSGAFCFFHSSPLHQRTCMHTWNASRQSFGPSFSCTVFYLSCYQPLPLPGFSCTRPGNVQIRRLCMHAVRSTLISAGPGSHHFASNFVGHMQSV